MDDKDKTEYVLQSDVGSLPGRLRGVWQASSRLKAHVVPSGGTVTLCRLDTASEAWTAESRFLPLPARVTCLPCSASLRSLRADPRRPLASQPPARPEQEERIAELEKAHAARVAELEAQLEAERDRVIVCAFWRQVAGFLIAQEPEGSVLLSQSELVAALRVRVTAAFEDDGTLSVSASYPRFTEKFRESLTAFTRGAAIREAQGVTHV